MLRPLVHGLNRPLLASLVERAAVGGTVNQSPVAGFSVTPTLLSVQVTDASSDDHGVTGYDYDWGDGTAHATTASPSHTYALIGPYTITQVVTDAGGKTAQTSHSVTVDITRDATSNKRLPQSAAQLVAIGAPALDHVYLCQDPSGNAADAVGSMNLTAAGSPSYQQAVTGWAAKALATTQATSQGFTVASGTGPSPSGSYGMAGWVKLTATPGGTRDLFGFMGASNAKIESLGTGHLRLSVNGVTADSASAYNDGNAHFLQLVYDKTHSTAKMYIDSAEVITGTFATGSDNTKGFGALGLTNSPADLLWFAIASSAAAEAMGASFATVMLA